VTTPNRVIGFGLPTNQGDQGPCLLRSSRRQSATCSCRVSLIAARRSPWIKFADGQTVLECFGQCCVSVAPHSAGGFRCELCPGRSTHFRAFLPGSWLLSG